MLPKSQRLRNRRDFRIVYSRGRSCVHPMLVLYVRRSRDRERRIGFSVSKKVGGAVERNRVKRRLRAAVRLRLDRLQSGFDAVFVARSALKTASFQNIQKSVDDLFERARLWEHPPDPESPSCGASPPS